MKSLLTRHVTLSYTVATQKIAGSGNPPFVILPVGAVNIQKSLKYRIKNFNITVSDLGIAGSGSFTDFVIYHRFWATKDPIQDFIDKLPSGYTLTFNGGAYTPNSFERTDIRDSSTSSSYNELKIENTTALTHTELRLLTVQTNTIHECIPISLNNKQATYSDFYFESRYNDILAFSMFPYFTFNVSSGQLDLAFDYSINFDLEQFE